MSGPSYPNHPGFVHTAYVKGKKNVTSRKLQRHLKIAEGSISGFPAWQAYLALKENANKGQGPRTRPLTRKMLESVKNHDRFIDQIAERELIERRLLEVVSDADRTKYWTMNMSEQDDMLLIFAQQQEDEQTDLAERPSRS